MASSGGIARSRHDPPTIAACCLVVRGSLLSSAMCCAAGAFLIPTGCSTPPMRCTLIGAKSPQRSQLTRRSDLFATFRTCRHNWRSTPRTGLDRRVEHDAAASARNERRDVGLAWPLHCHAVELGVAAEARLGLGHCFNNCMNVQYEAFAAKPATLRLDVPALDLPLPSFHGCEREQCRGAAVPSARDVGAARWINCEQPLFARASCAKPAVVFWPCV